MTTETTKQARTPDEIIRDERILDNIMVPVYFESGSQQAKAALEKILRVLLDDPGLTVQDFHAEHVLTNVGHHGVRIDIWARDGQGRSIALELQKDISEPLLHRSVFEAATMTVHSLKPGEDYSRIDRVVVIFVMERDLFGRGQAVYESETRFKDGGTEITAVAPKYVFVNGAYKDAASDLGRVIHDLTERDPRRMIVSELRERADMLKNTEEGRKKMSAALEAYTAEIRKESREEGREEGRQKGRQEGREEQLNENIRRMLKEKQEPAFISRMLGVSVQYVEEIQAACDA